MNLKMMVLIKKFIQRHYYLLIMLLVLGLLVLLHLNMLNNNVIEGFDISDITKIGDSVKDATNTISKIPTTMNDISNTLNNKITSSVNTLDSKYASNFTNIAKDIQNNATSFNNQINSTTNNMTNQVNSLSTKLDQQITSVTNKLEGEITSATNKLEGEITSATNKLEGEITSATNKLDQQIKSGINDLRSEMQKYVVDKFVSVFTQIGNMLKAGIIDPLTFMFVGLGNVFTQIFNIIKMVGEKIVSLPSCIFLYMFQGVLDTIYGIYMFILPNIITGPINTLYRNSLGIIINWFSDITGYTAAYNKCYKFNVNDEVDKMTQQFNQIGQKFNGDFGKIDFSKIKV
jgi:predicted PurR-regulated permease PerM